MSEDHEEGEQGVVKRESAWVFEAMCEITKAWKKEDQDREVQKFLVHIGKPRALDLFHRLDKDHSGTLTSKEFVYGVRLSTAARPRRPVHACAEQLTAWSH